jgi:predicted nucleic acid-binding protein
MQEMSGSSYLLDTNIIVYALKGLEFVKPYFEEGCYISVISEMEIISS